MVNNELIKNIISLAEKFYAGANKSIRSLFEEIEYPAGIDEPGEDEILLALLDNPRCIEDWFRWSEDKRTSEGWYIKEKSGKFELGYFPTGKNKMYADKAE